MRRSTDPKTTWVKGHQLKWGNPENPICSWCATKQSDVRGFCPKVFPHYFKKVGDGLGYFLIATTWNTCVAWLFLGVFWVIGALLSGGTVNVLMAENPEMLPGVPFWVVWLVFVNFVGWIQMLKDETGSR